MIQPPSTDKIWTHAEKHLRSRDQHLRRVIKQIGPCGLERAAGGFEHLVRTIIFQQLSLKAAGTIFSRVKIAAGTNRLTPPSVAKLRDEQLRSAGVSRNKITYLRDLCDKVSSRQISFHRFPRMSDEEVRLALTSVKGLGVWSADMYLIFVMNRPDVLPVLDQGLRNGACLIYGCEHKSIPWDELRERWTPYCSIASWYLWAYKNAAKNQ